MCATIESSITDYGDRFGDVDGGQASATSKSFIADCGDSSMVTTSVAAWIRKRGCVTA